MEQIILEAEERKVKAKKVRGTGFIPGVVYGEGLKEARSVKFPEKSLKKILEVHGPNAKLWVKSGEDKKFGVIKEIQKHPVTNKIIHLDVQLVNKDHEVRLQIPILFKGEAELAKKQLQLQIHKSEVEVAGKVDLIPEVIHVDVADKKFGDTIVFEDFALDKQIKNHDKAEEVYASIVNMASAPEEEAEEETAAVAEQ